MRNTYNDSDALRSSIEENAKGESVVRTRYRVSGMDCGSCAAKIETALKRISGVQEVSVSVPAGTVALTHHEATTPAKIAEQVAALGFGVERRDNPAGSTSTDHEPYQYGDGDHHNGLHVHGHDHDAVSEGPWWWSRKGVLTITSGIGLGIAYLIGSVVPAIERPAFLAALAIG